MKKRWLINPKTLTELQSYRYAYHYLYTKQSSYKILTSDSRGWAVG